MPSDFRLARIARRLFEGAVIAYPTEGVFGLGCLPYFEHSVERVIALKERDAGNGLILVAGSVDLFEGWIDVTDATGLESTAVSHPLTWVVPAGPAAYPLLTGGRPTLAVRISAHPVIARLSELAQAPLVSTSANRSGCAAITSPMVLRRQFATRVDEIVPGPLGAASGASEIRDFASGRVLRAYGAR